MTCSATAAVLVESGAEFVLDTVVLDDIKDHEILVRIEACGICYTDTACGELLPLPAVLGHEGTGVIEAIGAKVGDLDVGDTVILSYPSCGNCSSCRNGRLFLCEHIVRLKFDGCRFDKSRTIHYEGQPITSAFFQQSSFATYAVAPGRSAVKVDADLPAEVRAALPCGIQTGAGAVLNTFRAAPGDALAIAGVGSVGMSAVMAARLAGVSIIIAIDRNENRLELAMKLGATHVIKGVADETADEIKKIAASGLDYFLDTTSASKVWACALESLGMGGEFGFVESPPAREKYTPDFEKLLDRAAIIHGIIQGSSVPRGFIPKMIEWYRSGAFPVDRIIRTYDFSDINVAFEQAASGAVIKPVVLMRGGS